ncbi:alpha/beta fold hydrolase [Candidatus Dojkabacteria bacterium]|uniref:Alpha/beta fold hydrolase n=1 Tax=Candidatus Dojkabacteria bacterium TaxID=2099670 RepID=A0A955HYF7_9BACT|nr:alpha/beta fold hydrolase [Candidatus Dojkabacteria bacterium]
MSTKISRKKKVLFLALISISTIISIFLIYEKATSKTLVENSSDTNIKVTTAKTLSEKPEADEKVNSTTLKKYDKVTAIPGSLFFEDTPTLGSQQTYIAVPIEYDIQTPPTVILYSHGSNTHVTTDFNESFMKDLREYAEFFTKENYIFAASEQHGQNWGSQEAIDDTENLRQYISKNYTSKEKINLIGFSMGGLPTMNYALDHHDKVNRIALLAPTTYPTYWTTDRASKFKSISISLWHGNSDANVPISSSIEFIDIMKQGGISVVFHELNGKTHWDLDTEMKPEILKFFNK